MRILLCLGVVVTAACWNSFGPGKEVRVLGFIDSIEVPDTVSVSTPFTVSVVTVGLRGCQRIADTGLDLWDNHATIFPYDWSREESACNLIGTFMEHFATFEFDAVGVGTIIVRGRNQDRDRSPVEFQFSVWVE